jgi:hypothetical protein
MAMKRSLEFCLLVVIALPVMGQVPSPGVQQTSEKSICSNVVALTGNVNLNCSNLTVAQKKALALIPSLLKQTLTNQTFLEEIKARLDELEKPQQSIVINNAPNGFAISGGTVNNPSITNYGEKEPNILGFQLVTQSSPDTYLPDFSTKTKNHPTTSFKFYIDSAWSEPQFAAICDRPCHAIDVSQAKPSGGMIFPNFRVGTSPDYPNWAMFFVDLRPFKTFTYYMFTVVSEDDVPVQITRFSRLKANLMPQ